MKRPPLIVQLVVRVYEFLTRTFFPIDLQWKKHAAAEGNSPTYSSMHLSGGIKKRFVSRLSLPKALIEAAGFHSAHEPLLAPENYIKSGWMELSAIDLDAEGRAFRLLLEELCDSPVPSIAVTDGTPRRDYPIALVMGDGNQLEVRSSGKTMMAHFNVDPASIVTRLAIENRLRSVTLEGKRAQYIGDKYGKLLGIQGVEIKREHRS